MTMNLLEAIIRYRLEAQAYQVRTAKMTLNERQKIPEPAPPPLLWTALQLGDGVMLKAGGVLDQPAGLWQAAQFARSVWDLLKREGNEGFKDSLDDSEAQLWAHILDVRNDILGKNGHA